MKKKIMAIMLICGLCIGLCACGNNETVLNSETSGQTVMSSENTEPAEATESAEAEELEKSATVSKSVEVEGNPNMMKFMSENGYSVVYPKKYTVVPESAEIDFLVTDNVSGASVNVVTIPEDCSFLFEIEKTGYENMMLAQNMEVTLDLYEATEINGIPALKIKYTYNDTEFIQTYYSISDQRTHCVTYAKTAGVANDVAQELEAITSTLENTME